MLICEEVTYKPHKRGEFSVGVQTLRDGPEGKNGRPATVELWYPGRLRRGADEEVDSFQSHEKIPTLSQTASRDAKFEPGDFPIVGFSHGYGAHRRQSTYLCTHLASHGYIVFAPEHHGNTLTTFLGVRQEEPPDGAEADPSLPPGEEAAALTYRPADMERGLSLTRAWVKKHLTKPEASNGIYADIIGMVGHSFGGWTSLVAAKANPSVKGVVALATAGGPDTARGWPLFNLLNLPWEKAEPALFINCSRDSIVPVESTRQLYDKYNGAKRWVTIKGADHFHFCDVGEFVHEWFRFMPNNERLPSVGEMAPVAELSPPKEARDVSAALTVAHFDHCLKARSEAAAYLDSTKAMLAENGVDADVEASQS